MLTPIWAYYKNPYLAPQFSETNFVWIDTSMGPKGW